MGFVPTGSVLQLEAGATSLQQLADVSQIVAGVASLFIVLTVWLLRSQIGLQAQDGRTALITGMTALITSVGQAFIDYPEMRQYFYYGAKPEGADRDRARAIAVALAGAMDHAATHFERMDGPTQAAWKAYFADIYRNSPVFREHLATHRTWYGPGFPEYFHIDGDA